MGIGFSIFRRKRNGVPAKRYTIRLRLADGTTREVTAFTDKEASKQRGAALVRELERKEVGLHDQFSTARKTPLQEHVDAFLTSMENGTLGRRRRRGKPTDDWIDKARARLTRMLALMGVSRIEQLNVAAAEEMFAKQVRGGWSAKTRDDHAALLRQFGTWLVDDQRWGANPFHRLQNTRNEASKTFRRHALTVGQLGALVHAAEQRALQEYRKANPMARAEVLEQKRLQGWERGVLYQVAAYTGLRRREVTSLVWADVALGTAPAIEVRPETAKNRRRARLELPRWLGELLQEVRDKQAIALGATPPARGPVFAASYRHLTERLKNDAEWAELGERDSRDRIVDASGRVIDFHSLRGTLATLAAEVGMPPKLLQQHMRHSDIRLTMEVYAQVRSQAMRAEIERLPRPQKDGAPLPPPTPPAALPAPAPDCSSLPKRRRRAGGGR